MKSTQYKTGYIQGDFREINYETLSVLKKCKAQCGRLVAGIPSDDMLPRILDRETGETFRTAKELLESLRVVDEVVAADITKAGMEERFQDIRFDVCFCGFEYGRQYEQDKKYLEEHGAALIPLIPEGRSPLEQVDALKEALKNRRKGEKIILFGTGAYFTRYMEAYGEKYRPSYAVDNAPEKWGTVKEGIPVRNPEELRKEDANKVLVVLCCKDYKAVMEQLLSYGDFDYRPMRYYNKVALLDEYDILFCEEREYLERAQGALLELIREFDRVCREYNLRYYVVCGSLIGVVRHHDMIPWDDDIDIAMPRRDYEILKRKAGEIWKDSDFMLCGYDEYGNNLFHDFIGRFLYLKEDIFNSQLGISMGKTRKEIADKKAIDIFILDNALGGFSHKLVTTAIRGVYALAIPDDFDGVLKRQGYGNYMLMPPPGRRKPEHWLSFRKGV